MNALDKARDGRAAARQMRSLMRAGGPITERDMKRLLDKIDAGFEQMMGPDTVPPNLPPFHVLNGGRP